MNISFRRIELHVYVYQRNADQVSLCIGHVKKLKLPQLQFVICKQIAYIKYTCIYNNCLNEHSSV